MPEKSCFWASADAGHTRGRLKRFIREGQQPEKLRSLWRRKKSRGDRPGSDRVTASTSPLSLRPRRPGALRSYLEVIFNALLRAAGPKGQGRKPSTYHRYLHRTRRGQTTLHRIPERTGVRHSARRRSALDFSLGPAVMNRRRHANGP
jgi:hypothetical protein